MAKVYVLPGVERPDLAQDVPSRHVLERAVENGVTDVIVIGRDRTGDRYIASSSGDADRIVGALMWGVMYLSKSKMLLAPFETSDKED
jgi:hypothetical protein